jgi:hypothetical protein
VSRKEIKSENNTFCREMTEEDNDNGIKKIINNHRSADSEVKIKIEEQHEHSQPSELKRPCKFAAAVSRKEIKSENNTMTQEDNDNFPWSDDVAWSGLKRRSKFDAAENNKLCHEMTQEERDKCPYYGIDWSVYWDSTNNTYHKIDPPLCTHPSTWIIQENELRPSPMPPHRPPRHSSTIEDEDIKCECIHMEYHTRHVEIRNERLEKENNDLMNILDNSDIKHNGYANKFNRPEQSITVDSFRSEYVRMENLNIILEMEYEKLRKDNHAFKELLSLWQIEYEIPKYWVLKIV